MNGEVEYKIATHYNFKYLKFYLHSNLIAFDKNKPIQNVLDLVVLLTTFSSMVICFFVVLVNIDLIEF